MAKKTISKQLLRFGTWNHPSAPNGKLEITKEYAQKLVDNFNRTPFAPLLRGHASDDEANKNPELIISKNIKGLHMKDDGVYFDAEVDEKELDTYEDVSAGIQDDYIDHETNEKLGPVLRHVAFVTNPFIKGLKPFTSLGEDNEYFIFLSDIKMDDKAKKNTEEEVIDSKAEDASENEEVVEETTESTEEEETVEETVTEPTEEVAAKKEATINASEETSSEDLLAQIKELKEKEKQHAIQLAEIKQEKIASDANNLYEDYLRKGKVLRSFKNEIISLASLQETTIELADGNKQSVTEILKSLLDKMPTLINLKELGVNVEQGDNQTQIPAEEVERRRKIYLADNPGASEEDFKKHLEEYKPIILKHLEENN